MEILIGRLATDPQLRRRFAAQPIATLGEQGLELTEIELAALAATDPGALHEFARTLDARIQKARSAHPDPAIRDGSATRPNEETVR